MTRGHQPGSYLVALVAALLTAACSQGGAPEAGAGAIATAAAETAPSSTVSASSPPAAALPPPVKPLPTDADFGVHGKAATGMCAWLSERALAGFLGGDEPRAPVGTIFQYSGQHGQDIRSCRVRIAPDLVITVDLYVFDSATRLKDFRRGLLGVSAMPGVGKQVATIAEREVNGPGTHQVLWVADAQMPTGIEFSDGRASASGKVRLTQLAALKAAFAEIAEAVVAPSTPAVALRRPSDGTDGTDPSIGLRGTSTWGQCQWLGASAVGELLGKPSDETPTGLLAESDGWETDVVTRTCGFSNHDGSTAVTVVHATDEDELDRAVSELTRGEGFASAPGLGERAWVRSRFSQGNSDDQLVVADGQRVIEVSVARYALKRTARPPPPSASRR